MKYLEFHAKYDQYSESNYLGYIGFINESISAPNKKKVLRITITTVEIQSEHKFRVSHSAAGGDWLGGQE